MPEQPIYSQQSLDGGQGAEDKGEGHLHLGGYTTSTAGRMCFRTRFQERQNLMLGLHNLLRPTFAELDWWRSVSQCLSVANKGNLGFDSV